MSYELTYFKIFEVVTKILSSISNFVILKFMEEKNGAYRSMYIWFFVIMLFISLVSASNISIVIANSNPIYFFSNVVSLSSYTHVTPSSGTD